MHSKADDDAHALGVKSILWLLYTVWYDAVSLAVLPLLKASMEVLCFKSMIFF
jgi:hypothetical protein